MPLAASGTLFAKLQALAMGGVGIGSISVAGGALGGAAGVAYLRDFCAFVDEYDPDSAIGIAFEGRLTAVTTAIKTKEHLKAQCASSESCTAAAGAGVAMANAAITTAIETKERLGSQCAASETCTAATEVGAAAAKYVSSLWNGFIAGLKEGFDEQKTENSNSNEYY